MRKTTIVGVTLTVQSNFSNQDIVENDFKKKSSA